MPTEIAELPGHVQTLLLKRDEHIHAISMIDATLAKVNAALGVTMPVKTGPKPMAVKAAPAAKAAIPKAKPGKRIRRKFAVSGSESVLAFIKAKKNPTTSDIKQQWLSEGRGGGIDNTLSILTKEKKLKRTPLGKGIRGSRYSLA